MPEKYTDYIPPSKEKNILEFKYQGRDDSLLYNHVTGKLSQYLTDNFLPITIA
jgi:hypothetical protein